MSTSTPRPRRILGVGLVAGAVGTTVNATIYGLGRASDVQFVIRKTATGPQLVHLTDVVSFSLMSVAVGLIAAVTLTRFRPRALDPLTKLAAVIAVASTAMDLPIAAAAPAKLLLASMHLAVGTAFIAGLRVSTRGIGGPLATPTPEPPVRLAA